MKNRKEGALGRRCGQAGWMGKVQASAVDMGRDLLALKSCPGWL